MHSVKFLALSLVLPLMLASKFAFSQDECSVFQGADALEGELLASSDVMELAAIADDFMARVASADHDALREAYSQNDEAEITSLLGFTPAEMDDVAQALEKHSSNLIQAFPEIERFMPRGPVAIGLSDSEMIDLAISMAGADEGGLRQAANGGVDCAWVPYTASLALCTATGHLYWACAAIAVCSWCSGGWVDQMCAIP